MRCSRGVEHDHEHGRYMVVDVARFYADVIVMCWYGSIYI